MEKIKEIIERNYILKNDLKGFINYGILGTELKKRIIELYKKEHIERDIKEIEETTIISLEEMEKIGKIQEEIRYIIEKEGEIYKVEEIIKEEYKKKGRKIKKKEIRRWSKKKIEKIMQENKMIEKNKEIEENNRIYGIKTSNKENKIGIDFLRIELLQNMMRNYKRIKEYYNKEEFGILEVGRIYRKETKEEEYKLREMTSGKIKYFYDKKNEEIKKIEGIEINIKEGKEIKKRNTKEIDEKEIIKYFIEKMYKYVRKCGIKEENIRIKKKEEKEKYEKRKWVMKIKINEKWIKIGECRDKGKYEIICNEKKEGEKYRGKRKMKEKKIINKREIEINEEEIEKKYPEERNEIIEYYKKINKERNSLEEKEKEIEENEGIIYEYINDKVYIITKEMIKIKKKEEKKEEEEYIPEIIESEIYIDRMLKGIIYNSYEKKEEKIIYKKEINPYELYICDEIKEKKKEKEEIINEIERNEIKIYIDNRKCELKEKMKRVNEYGTRYILILDEDIIKKQVIKIIDREKNEKQNKEEINIRNLIKKIKEIIK